MDAVGVNKEAIGCELCKPAVGSILSSLYNEHVMMPIHHQNQDTNDRCVSSVPGLSCFGCDLHMCVSGIWQTSSGTVRILGSGWSSIEFTIIVCMLSGTFSVIPKIAAGEVPRWLVLSQMLVAANLLLNEFRSPQTDSS